MALIDEATSACAICGERLTRPYIATSGVAFPSSHPLWPYCDAPLHVDCLATWPHRMAFAAGYFERSLTRFQSAGGLLRETPRWLLGAGLVGSRVTYLDVVMREWPIRFNAQREEWSDYLGGRFRQKLAGPALEAAEAIIPDVVDASIELGLISATGDTDPLTKAIMRRSLLLVVTLAACARSHPADQPVPSAPAARTISAEERVVQAQLEAYNRRDLDAFAATYAPDIRGYNYPDQATFAGLDSLRAGYARLFASAPALRATVLQRIVQGRFVIDHEEVTGLPNGRTVRAVAIYEVRSGLITSVRFLR